MPSREQLERLLEKDPDDVFLNFALAMALAKEGSPSQALARFDRVLELDPTYTAAHLQKGTRLIAMGRRDEARLALQTGVTVAKTAGDAHAADEMQKLLDTMG
jgi:predicted Zn-dependent protease